MATTKITSNVLAPNAAQNNINSDSSFSVSIPTQFTNTLTANSSVIIDSSSSVANPKLLILATSTWGSDDNSALVIKGSGINKVASVNLRATGASGELYNGWISGRVGSGIVINNSFFVNNGGSGPQTGNTSFSVLANGNVGIGTSTPASALDIASGNLFVRTGNVSVNTIATYNNSGPLTLNYQGGTFSVINNATTVIHATQAGNVGIGTTTPNERLTVSGNISASDTTFTSKLGVGRTTMPAGVTFGVGPNVINDSNLPVQYSSSTAINYIGLNAQSVGSYGGLIGYTESEFGGGLVLRTVPSRAIRFVTDNNSQRMVITPTAGNVGIGTDTPNERLTVSGNISASGTVTATNLVYNTGDQPIAGIKTFSDNIVGNGTTNRLPNQTATTSSDIITRSLSDARHSNRNKRITDDTTFTQSVWEQFIDFDDQYNADLVVANAFGPSNFAVSPQIFGEQWNTGNVGVTFQGNDLYTHRGVLLLRGQASSNGCMYMGVNRPTNSYVLTGITNEFTVRTFVKSSDFTTQGFFKLGPIPKGGTGGGDASLLGGLMFNPYLHPTNLVIGVSKFGVASPFTFTTNPANMDFLDTGFNFLNILDRWINITYKMDYTNTLDPVLTVSIVRENVTLFTQNYRVLTDPIISTWSRKWSLYGSGASTEIGLQYGKFTYTSRSEIYFDYFYYKTTGVSSAPSNWNSLRF